MVRAWTLPGGGGGRPVGTTEPRPYGPPLRPADISRALRGRAAALYEAAHDRWYIVVIAQVSPSLGTAVVRYAQGRLEDLDLEEIMKQRRVVLVT